ncbi:MAG: hypothetical protein JW793_04710 [Acidobacteria bacterium]|nr:hypothetical protein [Acidobacteriota bacterium]
MNKENMWKPAVIGGLLLGVLSSLPILNCACCAWVLAGGILAAYLYVRESALVATLGQGMTLGFLTGAIGTAVIALFSIPLILMSPEGSRGIAEQIRELVDQVPGFPAQSREEIAELTSREGFMKIVFFTSLFAQLAVNCLLAMLGGALGVAIFEKRKPGGPPAQTPDTLPPPPPDQLDG